MEHTDYRYERKFFIDEMSRNGVEHLVKMHPSFFREIHHERTVNNIYLDTPDFRSFHDNVDGLSERTKVRIRWYGEREGLIERPVLEFKIKSDMVGRKDLFPLSPLSIHDGLDTDEVFSTLRDSKIEGEARLRVERLECKMLNRYTRRYYESLCKRYRITIDSDLEFYRLQRFGNRFLDRIEAPQCVVLEIKYDRDDDTEADQISAKFPFLVSKMSKYVYGVDHLWGQGINSY